jgi:nitrite reductase/ring-hydroxylating ferredoxin subunit
MLISDPVAGRFPFSSFPDGWFAVAFSKELTPGTVRPRTLFGREHVLFRTESGQPVLLDAFCPHMGAHLGHGGRVEGETIRCPMHGFRFDGEGACVKTGYGTRPPPKCQSASTPLREVDGVIYALQRPTDRRGQARGWEPPEVGFEGWAPLRTALFEAVSTHPQETTENSVDLGHFAAVHGYEDVEIISPLETDGPHLTISYRMRRRNLIPGLPRIATRFDITIWGLGYSFVEVSVENMPLSTRYLVLPTPRSEGLMDLRLAMTFRVTHPVLGRIPMRLYGLVFGRLHADSFVGDVLQDFDIWKNKQYVHPPILAKGDGPIGQYRRWARQFYDDERLEARAAAE